VVVCVAAACITLPEFFECRVQPTTNGTTRLDCVPTWFGRWPGYSLGYRYANQALFTFFPLLLLAIFNSMLIHAVLMAARRRQVIAKTGSQCGVAGRSSPSAPSASASASAAAAANASSSHERQRRAQQRITVLMSGGRCACQ